MSCIKHFHFVCCEMVLYNLTLTLVYVKLACCFVFDCLNMEMKEVISSSPCLLNEDC